MNGNLKSKIEEICQRYDNDPSRMMDIVREAQVEGGVLTGEAMELIAGAVGSHRVEVESVASFYSFFSLDPRGKIVIRVCDDVVDKMKGYREVVEAFEQELGLKLGETSEDGAISLVKTACIGMCDQAPAALINDRVVPDLTPDLARKVARTLKESGDVNAVELPLGDGNNAVDLVHSAVSNNIVEPGEVLFAPFERGTALRKAVSMSPVEVIKQIKISRLRGRGGAGFPAGLKWEFARSAQGDKKFILCNADEGEPGTFKDRVILTEAPDLLMEGMTIAGYALGADTGIVYLRGEYAYLRAFLENVIEERRKAGLLGKDIVGNDGFDFDIRIQMGAGAYICGEETALISSCEGLRGDPKNRPPFPAQKGYLGYPTTVNNVETLCCVARILNRGAAWFAEMGSETTSGTKLLSVSGDCKTPGIFEVPFGLTVAQLLERAGGTDAIAVQVGGPSGRLVAPAEYDRKICFDDLGTGGSVVVFGPGRSIPEVAREYMEFFVDESCGFCTPCRVGNRLMLERLDLMVEGRGTPEDLSYLEELGKVVSSTSRCGLGQTSPNPVLTSLEGFRGVYEELVGVKREGELLPSFDLEASLKIGAAAAGREER